MKQNRILVVLGVVISIVISVVIVFTILTFGKEKVIKEKVIVREIEVSILSEKKRCDDAGGTFYISDLTGWVFSNPFHDEVIPDYDYQIKCYISYPDATVFDYKLIK